MEAKLIKDHDNYHLVNDKQFVIGTTDKSILSCTDKYNLSLKNCQAIELGYDLDELASQKYLIENTGSMFMPNRHEVTNIYRQEGFIEGAKAILEILGDKKFSEEDAKRLFELGIEHGHRDGYVGLNYTNECIQSLQQTEWDVEIVMERYPGLSLCAASPELDADGNLILKRK